MSRNTQRESLKTPTKSKRSKKPKQTFDYSSDSTYAGVDEISDDEVDFSDIEPAVFWDGASGIEKYEEEAMLRSAEENDDLDSVEDDTDAEETFQESNTFEEWSGFTDSAAEQLDDNFVENMYSTQDSDNNGTPYKASSSDLSDEESDWHADLFENESGQAPFLSRDALPARVLERLEDDTYNDDNGFDDFGWETGNDDVSEEESEESDSDESDASGYQSDDDLAGETTDDEDWRDGLPDVDEPATRERLPEPPQCLGFRICRKAGQPDIITWYHNTDVPFVILDEKGKAPLMYPSKPPRTHDDSSPSPSMNRSMNRYNPALSNEGNTRMNSAIGPAVSYYFEGNIDHIPGTNLLVEDDVRPTSSSSYDESEDQNASLPWGDLFDFDAALSEGEDEGEGGLVEQPSSTPAHPTTSDGLHPLLVHLDKSSNVAAFRLNRQNENLLNSNTVSKEALAFGTSTIKGVKNGHLDSLTSSLTPRRKPKALLPSSPAGAVANRKRKSTSEGERSHKRNRSNV